MITMNQLKSALADGNVKYIYIEETDSIYFKERSRKYNFENTIVLKVSDDYEYVDIVCNAFTFEEITRSVLSLVNELNSRFKFFSFYVDESNHLLLTATAIVKENNSIEEVLELIIHSIDIMDKIYPDVQRIIWK